jgi:hypothetical protein
MTQPKKIPIGQKRSRFPGGTLNALVEDFYQRRGRTARPNLTRPNEAISPSIVRLWWEGEDPIGVGSEVKLGEVLVKPENDPSAPFQGLQFRCSAPASDDEGGSVYAITTAPGPANSIVWGLMPSATWAKVDVQDEADTHASHGDGLLLTTGTSGYPIVWKEDGTGEKWAVILIGDTGLIKVMITASVSAATYSGGVLTPSSFTARRVKADGTNDPGDTIACTNPFPDGLTVGVGKALVGKVEQNGELVSVSCSEITL